MTGGCAAPTWSRFAPAGVSGKVNAEQAGPLALRPSAGSASLLRDWTEP